MPQRTLIKDLQPAQLIEGIFAIHNCQLGQTKTGKPYIKCLLSDRSARTPGRMWNASEDFFKGLPTDGFVWVEGQAQPYQGEMQVIIQNMYGAEPMESDLDWLMPKTRFDIGQMYSELTGILGTVKNPTLRAIVDAYLADEALMERMRRAPAAVTMHHAFIGGLLEHTLSLVRSATALLPLYPELNAELVIVGLFLHDLGKCQELAWDKGFSYSDDGQLVGHIVRGAIWLRQKAEALKAGGTAISEPVVNVLEHIILSHHGQAEFGAAKLPSTPEAIFVSLLDNLDAKLNMAIAATRTEDLVAKDAAGEENGDKGGLFTEKIWALDTRLYRPDPTKL